MKKNTKKTATVVGMFGLLGLVLGMGGSTFAKYQTRANAPKVQATVAKWGFVANANANNLFPGASIEKRTEVAKDTNGNVIVRADGTNVVAPGHSGSINFSVTGSAEVKADIEIVAEGTEICLTKTSDPITKYYPLVWTLTENDATKDVTPSTPDRLADIITYINSKTATVNVGDSANFSYSLAWSWAFYVNDDTDKLDTYLGTIANNGTVSGYSAELNVSFGVSISVTQAD